MSYHYSNVKTTTGDTAYSKGGQRDTKSEGGQRQTNSKGGHITPIHHKNHNQ